MVGEAWIGGRTAAEWLAGVRDAERRGELLSAVDLAGRGLEEHPGDPGLRYRSVLALARAGSTDQAARRFDELALAAVDTEDVAALAARITKDRALAAAGAERRRLAAAAADAYGTVGGGYFPVVNAATMSLVAGDAGRARTLAGEALALVDASGEGGYFAAATEAEARLLLGDEDGARAALGRAAALADGDYGALSTTRRQLRTVCAELGVDPGLLAALSGPAVAHFCGHLIAPPGRDGRFRAVDEGTVAAEMAGVCDRLGVGVAYGSLAGGGDILWAEALLRRGAELHVVLPFAREEFVRTSVTRCGPGWDERFERCLVAARTVSYATEDAYLGDDVLYGYCASLAMGLALLRARYLDAEVHQLALWDGEDPTGPAGTAADVATWRAAGRHAVVVAPGPALAREAGGREPHEPDDHEAPHRVVRAMLIGDVRGFSTLSDEQVPAFTSVVLGAFAQVLAGYPGEVEYANTWGDALFAVLAHPAAAARAALDLQEAMVAIDLEAAGLPAHLALRLSGHVGPVFTLTDPVLGRPSFMGSHVSRTARIEPVTPPGAVFVTDAFAAALEVSGEESVGCDYVGHLPAAKDYGRLRMYRIWRRDA
jgi:class 3 adenylate cyclase